MKDWSSDLRSLTSDMLRDAGTVWVMASCTPELVGASGTGLGVEVVARGWEGDEKRKSLIARSFNALKPDSKEATCVEAIPTFLSVLKASRGETLSRVKKPVAITNINTDVNARECQRV